MLLDACPSGTSPPVRVECEHDIVAAVCAARERGSTVRAVGARGSKNDCYCTDGVSLEFNRYDRVVAFGGDTVTVQAGMKIGALNEFLRDRGESVPTCGEWQGATVAGSMATGSHGGSARHGIHSGSALGFRLVTSDGRAVDVDRSDPRFDHVAVSMGTLGIISTVTLACVDSFHLELETRVLAFDRYLRDHVALNAAAEFFAAVWFPGARRVLTFAANRVPPQAPTRPRMERFSVTTFLLDAAARYFHVDAVSPRRLDRRSVDHGDRILCPIPDRTGRIRLLRAISEGRRAMEAAVPASRSAEALVAFDSLLTVNGRAMLNAVGLRTSASDSFSLSPCHGRDTYWIDLFFSGGHPRFADLLRSSIEGLDGRCHWGKHVGLPAEHLRAQYPRLHEFQEVRAATDPDGVQPVLEEAGAMTGRTGLAAVTGATGFLGEALVNRLLGDRPVRALIRRPDERSAAWARRGCEIVLGDLDDERALGALVERADVVHHCAATMAKSDPGLSHRVNVAGTERLALASAAAGVRRFVHVSSISVYSATRSPDGILTEDVEPEHTDRLNHYARTKLEGEQAVLRIGRDHGLSYTILRPANIYGLRSGPWFRQWEHLLRVVPIAFGDIPIDLVYVDDVAEAMVAAAESPAAQGEVFNIGHEMVAMSRLIVEVGHLTGRRARVLPRMVDRLLCVAVDRGFRLVTLTALSPSLIRPVFYPHDKATAAFGYTPRFGLSEAFADMARRYHQQAGRSGASL